ncbi:MAG: poly-beta-1,6 N-acetyl-D-glucosamine export porin PgaA [Verrucomicrobia bacterium]|nr:poly-beta-1,6 N-acetyl-D-glucosamine export porin PgaA [Verrucomicrobiota bacterium]
MSLSFIKRVLSVAVFLLVSGICFSTEQATKAEHARAVALAREGDHDAALNILEKLLKDDDGNLDALNDYILVLSWADRHAEAVASFEGRIGAGSTPVFVVRAAANSYRELRKFDTALDLYNQLLARDKDDVETITGLCLTMVAAGETAKALAMIESILPGAQDKTSLYMAKAEVLWAGKDYLGAAKAFDEIIAISPTNRAAINLKIRVISDMGAQSVAEDAVREYGSLIDPDVRQYVRNNRAALQIRWGEPHLATNTLAELLGSGSAETRRRAAQDLILALAAMREWRTIVDIFERIENSKAKVPSWIWDSAAAAYLTLQNPKKAVELYRKALELDPRNVNIRMGYFFALMELGDFGTAGDVRDKLERETPEWIMDRGVLKYNWKKQEVVEGKGLWLAYQDRLAEAQQHFESMLEIAPGNTASRSGLAQIQAWRGWPGSSLRNIDISLNMAGIDPLSRPTYVEEREVPARITRAADLNACYYKQESRVLAAELIRRNPMNLHAKSLTEDLDVEDSISISFDGYVTSENPGIGEKYASARITMPVTSSLDIYGLWLFRDNSLDGVSHMLRRAGAGIDYDVFRALSIGIQGSDDYVTRDEEGLSARLSWRANDLLTLEAGHDTRSLDLPLRARAGGVSGNRTDAALTFRNSESFLYRLRYALGDLDDGNENTSMGLSLEEWVFTRASFRIRLKEEVSRVQNSETAVAYFSPRWANTVAISPVIEHVPYRRYGSVFAHRLILGGGFFEQVDFGRDFIWDLRYEHDYMLGKRTTLLWGLNRSRRYYDGEPADVSSFYLTFRQVL